MDLRPNGLPIHFGVFSPGPSTLNDRAVMPNYRPMEIDRLTLSIVLGLAERAPIKHPQEAEARQRVQALLAATLSVDDDSPMPDAKASDGSN